MPRTKKQPVKYAKRKPATSTVVARKRQYSARGTIRGQGEYHVPGFTPGAYLGRGLGYVAGWPLGMPNYGSKVGAAAGHLAGTLLGFGDYTGNERSIKVNSIINPVANAPVVRSGLSTKSGVIFTRQEYVTDIVSSSTPGQFLNQQFVLNPGQATTFPWLSSVAQNFEQYRIRGLVFCFKSLSADALNSTNTALGFVAMATQYDVLDSPFSTKQQLENYDMAQSTKPSSNQLHGVECAKKASTLTELYIRTGSVPSGADPRMYDFGVLNIATGGMQGASVTVGELWVTYEIELMKPKIPPTIGGDVNCGRVTRTNGAGAAPLGLAVNVNRPGPLNVTTSTNVVNWVAEPGATYYVTVTWVGTSATITLPTVTPSSTLTTYNMFNNNSQGQLYSPGGGATSASLLFEGAFTASNSITPGATVFVTFGTAGTTPTVANVDIFVWQLDTSILN